jgi:hypothetical protein
VGSKLDIKKSLKKLMETSDEIYTIPCTVDSVDLAEKTCYCIPLDKRGDLQGVRLMADNKVGFYIIPKVNSVVLVTMINETTGYVAMFSQVDEIQLNGDLYGGVPIVQNLVNKLNDLETAFNQHVVLYNAHIHVETTVNTLVPTVPDTQVLVPTVVLDLENETVNHGNGT